MAAVAGGIVAGAPPFRVCLSKAAAIVIFFVGWHPGFVAALHDRTQIFTRFIVIWGILLICPVRPGRKVT
jgi:hypothetical protein